MRRIAEIPAVTFLQIFSVLLFQDRCLSIVTPRAYNFAADFRAISSCVGLIKVTI